LSQGRVLHWARWSLRSRAGPRSFRIRCPVRCCQMACTRVIMVGESLTRPWSRCHCTPAALRGVGTFIECGCPLVAFGRSLPQVLFLSLEAGSGEVDMTSLVWGSLGRDRDLHELMPCPIPVHCDGSQQYPRKLSTKKISRFFLLVVSALRIIFFYERTSTIGSKSATPSLASPTSKVS
jgi:hypothetical protein